MVLQSDSDGMTVYMTRRGSRSRFMPDAYVFPGGAVDPSDGERPHAYGVAALRELFEEAGMLIACDAAGNPARLDDAELTALRTSVATGRSLVKLLRAKHLLLDTRELAYYSNWITPASEPIRFDAHFFVAHAPEGQIASADATEVHDGIWIAPREALARAERGTMTIRFPTLKHLERLARFDDPGAFMTHARARTVVPVMPVEDGTDAFGLGDGADTW